MDNYAACCVCGGSNGKPTELHLTYCCFYSFKLDLYSLVVCSNIIILTLIIMSMYNFLSGVITSIYSFRTYMLYSEENSEECTADTAGWLGTDNFGNSVECKFYLTQTDCDKVC